MRVGQTLMLASTMRLARWAVTGMAGAVSERIGYHPPVPDTPPAIVRELFERRLYPGNWFTEDLRNTLPPAKLKLMVDALAEQFGSLRNVRSSGEGYLAELERGSVPVMLTLDLAGRLASLRFSTASPRFGSLEEAAAAFRKLPESLSLLVIRNNEQVLAIEPERLMAVGSAFKLAILKVLAGQVAAGKIAWTDLVPLEPGWRALPSGVLHDWPAEVLLTVQTLACLMISMSDNTATTAVLELVGREQVEAIAPHCRPFLSPREFFILKSAQAHDLRKRYLRADTAGRRAVLQALRDIDLPRGAEVLTFGNRDIEWLFTARELCGFMNEVAALPAMRINPGLADKREWRAAAFKGGSDTGVLSLNTWLEGANGTNWCISANWNSEQPLKSDLLYSLYTALIDLLRRST